MQIHTAVSTKVVPHSNVKAYATLPIGIMGSHSLVFLDGGYKCFRRETVSIHMFGLFSSVTLKHH